MTDGVTIPSALDAADPLGRRRCPNCLYDRLGLDAPSPCPECGYVVPAGVVVLTLPRVRQSAWSVGASIVLIAFVVGTVVQDPAGTFHSVDYLTAMLACGIVAVAIRWWRISGVNDAYVSQLWLTSAGVGLERDADRFSTARQVDRVATPILQIAPYLAIFVVGRPIWRHAAIVIEVTALVVGSAMSAYAFARWRRQRAFAPKIDAVAPAIVRWQRLKSIKVGRVTGSVVVKTVIDGFVDLHPSIRFHGDDEAVGNVLRAIEEYRRGATITGAGKP